MSSIDTTITTSLGVQASQDEKITGTRWKKDVSHANHPQIGGPTSGGESSSSSQPILIETIDICRSTTIKMIASSER